MIKKTVLFSISSVILLVVSSILTYKGFIIDTKADSKIYIKI